MARKALWVALAGLLLASTGWAVEVARPRKKALDLPAAWRALSAKQRLMATRAAEVDADRLLIERIYGLQINADTLVLDLALASDEMRADVEHMIRGIRTQEVKYTDDLTVEVVKVVTIRELIETIERTLRRKKVLLGIREEEIKNIRRYTRDTVLGAMGNGAPKGTKGLRMIQAKRAAEVDAYRKLAEIVVGVRINSTTHVRDLVLESDRIATCLAAGLKGAKPTDIAYNDDGSCEVTMELVIRETIETVWRSTKRYGRGDKVKEHEWRKVTIETRDKIIKVTGNGAPREAGAGELVGEGAAALPFYQETQIIRRVIAREVGVIK